MVGIVNDDQILDIFLQEDRLDAQYERKKEMQINSKFWRPEQLEGRCQYQVTGRRLDVQQVWGGGRTI